MRVKQVNAKRASCNWYLWKLTGEKERIEGHASISLEKDWNAFKEFGSGPLYGGSSVEADFKVMRGNVAGREYPLIREQL